MYFHLNLIVYYANIIVRKEIKLEQTAKLKKNAKEVSINQNMIFSQKIKGSSIKCL